MGLKSSERRLIDDEEFKREFRNQYYQWVHRTHKGHNEPRWRGTRVVKFPTDLILYAEVIYANKPDVIVETGTRFGGSANFFADMLSLFVPDGKVITVDVENFNPPPHPRVEYRIGSSTDKTIVEDIAKQVQGKKVMVVLDSDHREKHVRLELYRYRNIVTPGQFIVVEDVWTYHREAFYPAKAIAGFLTKYGNNFQLEDMTERFVVGVTRDGWIRRVK